MATEIETQESKMNLTNVWLLSENDADKLARDLVGFGFETQEKAEHFRDSAPMFDGIDVKVYKVSLLVEEVV